MKRTVEKYRAMGRRRQAERSQPQAAYSAAAAARARLSAKN